MIEKRNYGNYEEYVEHQKKKTIDESLRAWLLQCFEKRLPKFIARLYHLLEENIINLSMNVLCVAARMGEEVASFNLMGFKAIGIDLVPNPPLVITGDMQKIPFEDKSFSIIYCNALDHCFDVKLFMAECERVLKNDGIVIFDFYPKNYGEFESINISSVDDIVNNTNLSVVRIYQDNELPKLYSCENIQIILRKENKLIELFQKPVLLLVAHWDDEVISAGGSIYRFGNGWDIVSVTSRDNVHPDYREKFNNLCNKNNAKPITLNIPHRDLNNNSTEIKEDILRTELLKYIDIEKYRTVITHSYDGDVGEHVQHKKISSIVPNIFPNANIFMFSQKHGSYIKLKENEVSKKKEFISIYPTAPEVNKTEFEYFTHYRKIKDYPDLCFSVISNGPYQVYIPLFIYFASKMYPKSMIYIYSHGELNEDTRKCINLIKDVCNFQIKNLTDFTDCDINKLGPDEFKTLRWTIYDKDWEQYNYLYIGDLDMLLVGQTLMDFHLDHCKKNNLCYSNTTRKKCKFCLGEDTSKLSGLHFVKIKEYFSKVMSNIELYRNKLKNGELKNINNEKTLMNIVKESGLSIPEFEEDFFALRHHGLHLRSFDSLEHFRNVMISTQSSYPIDYLLKPNYILFLNMIKSERCQKIINIFSKYEEFSRQINNLISICKEIK
ncbi:MAG: methyltransferase domain-containing protein [Nanoarchaeota archaeon]